MLEEIILIGGGGHCTAVIDVIELAGIYKVAGIVDKTDTSQTLDYPYLGDDTLLPTLRSSYTKAFITVGQLKTPDVRIRLFDMLNELKFSLPVLISPRGYVSHNSKIADGTIIMHDVLVNSRAIIGRNCIINSKALIEHDAVIEDNCHISTGTIINGGSIVKTGTFVGSNSVTKEYSITKENDFIKAGSMFRGYR